MLMDLISPNEKSQGIIDNFIVQAIGSSSRFSFYSTLEGNRAGKTLLQFTSSSFSHHGTRQCLETFLRRNEFVSPSIVSIVTDKFSTRYGGKPTAIRMV